MSHLIFCQYAFCPVKKKNYYHAYSTCKIPCFSPRKLWNMNPSMNNFPFHFSHSAGISFQNIKDGFRHLLCINIDISDFFGLRIKFCAYLLKMEMVFSPMGVYPAKIVPSPFQEKFSRCPPPQRAGFFIIPKIPAGRRRAPRRDKPVSLSRPFRPRRPLFPLTIPGEFPVQGPRWRQTAAWQRTACAPLGWRKGSRRYGAPYNL